MARTDYFLKLEGIPGESTDKTHKNEIDVLSWAWGQNNGGSHGEGGGGGTGKVVMRDFAFSMKMNKATPKLFLYCATGKPIKEALLTCRKAGGKQEEFLKIKFTTLLVSDYQTGGPAGADPRPDDHIKLNFTKMEITYAPQGDAGPVGAPVTHWYDTAGNEGA